MIRTASAHWEGDLKAGNGSLSTQSTVLNKTKYSYNTRFADGIGTNPEELLAAAHAGCFTMAVSMMLGKTGFTATSLDTFVTVILEGLAITGVHIDLKGKVPNISGQQFSDIAKDAEKNCIISKALSVPITSQASLG